MLAFVTEVVRIDGLSGVGDTVSSFSPDWLARQVLLRRDAVRVDRAVGGVDGGCLLLAIISINRSPGLSDAGCSFDSASQVPCLGKFLNGRLAHNEAKAAFDFLDVVRPGRLGLRC